jgi:hypothetical protein
MMTSSVKNRRVDLISVLLQEYNIEKIIHIKGQHNCLADYLSRHPIHGDDDEIFTEDYGISVLFSEEPPTAIFVPDQETLTLNAAVTRSKTRHGHQREHERVAQPNHPPVEKDDIYSRTTMLIHHLHHRFNRTLTRYLISDRSNLNNLKILSFKI